MEEALIEIYFSNSGAGLVFTGQEVRLIDITDQLLFIELEPNLHFKTVRQFNIDSEDFLHAIITDGDGIKDINEWSKLKKYLEWF